MIWRSRKTAAAALWLGAAISVWWFGSRWLLFFRVPVASLLIVIAAVALGRALATWWGPLFRYDIVRMARRGQDSALRTFYACVLVAMLLIVGWMHFGDADFLDLIRGQAMRREDLATFARSTFVSIASVQFIVILLITPLYVAPAIAEEKERRTFEFMLTTALTDREIVLGILGARLAGLLLLLLTGLPIVIFMALLGGVNPEQILAAFLISGASVLSLSCLSILMSVFSRTALAAIVGTYLWALLLFLPMGCLMLPVLAGSTPDVLGALVIVGVVIHGVIALTCGLWAVNEMRPVALAHANRSQLTSADRLTMARTLPVPPPPEHVIARAPEVVLEALPVREAPRRHQHRLPPITGDALRWKELEVEHYIRPAEQADYFACLSAIAIMLLLVVGAILGGRTLTGQSSALDIQPWVRSVNTALTFILMVLGALNAAGRISREREKNTLDGLLVLPVSAADITFSKWLGAAASVRWCCWGYPLIWGFGVLTGSLHPAAVPFLAAAVIVYLSLASALGLFLSTAIPSTMRATLLTVLLILIVITGPGLLVRALRGQSSYTYQANESARSWKTFMEYGLTPSATLAVISFRTGDWIPDENADVGRKDPSLPRPFTRLLHALGGLYVYLAAAAVLWLAALDRLLSLRGARPRRAHARCEDDMFAQTSPSR